MSLEVVILGCGSSGGVPRANGDWGACNPADPRNRRSRCSLAVRRQGPGGVTAAIVDTSPDLRHQTLAAGITHIDGVMLTHDHADQTHGIDDLRTFAYMGRRRVPVWLDGETLRTMETRFAYIFRGEHGYPAICDAHVVAAGDNLAIAGAGGAISASVFGQRHGPIASLGYRFGPVAYSSDVSALDGEALDNLKGVELWIVDALRWTRHPTHAHVDQALAWIAEVGARKAVLTNLHIDLDYEQLSRMLPANVSVAYDGWRVAVDA